MSEYERPVESEAAYSYAAIADLGKTILDTHGSFQLLLELQNHDPTLGIRTEQLECLDVLADERARGENRALVQMAPGTGKTTVVAADVYRFLESNRGARVLFLCHQNDILDQAKERFEHIVGEKYSYGKFTGEAKDYHELDCLFASFQAMSTWREAFLEDEFDYIVVDESHHGKATTYEPTIKYFKPQFLLGVTATPDRADLRDIRELFGPEKYQLSLEEAIARDLLCEVDYRVITDEVVDKQKLIDTRGRRYSLAQLDRTIFAPKRAEEIVSIINQRSEGIQQPRRIVFCKSVAQADEYAGYFKRSAALHHDIDKGVQNQQIRRFRQGAIHTLTVVDMFNEGIDIPDANQIIFLRSTDSRNVFLQQLGRGLRKHPSKDKVQVLDFVANCDRLLMLSAMWQKIEAIRQTQGRPSDEARKYIHLGDLHFDEEAKDILQILDDIGMQTALIEFWGADESISLYMGLYDSLGRVPDREDIYRAIRNHEAPSMPVLLRPFGNSLIELKRACGVEIPNGWESFNKFATKHNVPILAAERTAERLGLELPIYTMRSQQTRALSPIDQGKLLNEPEFSDQQQAPPEFLKLTDMSKALKLSRAIISKAVKELDLEPIMFKGLNNREYAYYSPGQVDQVKSATEHIVREVPQDYIRLGEVISDTGFSRGLIVNACKNLGIEFKFLVIQGKHDERYISQEALTRLSEYIESTSKPDEDYVSLNELATKHNITTTTAAKILKDAGITISKFRNENNSLGDYIKENEASVIESNQYVSLPSRPSDHVTLRSITSTLHIGRKRAQKLMTELGITGAVFRDPERKGSVGRYYSPEDVQKIQSQLG